MINKKLLFWLLVCLAILLLAASALYVVRNNNSGVRLGGAKLTGTLYLTLQPLADSSNINIYSFNLANKSLAPVFNNGQLNLTPALSPNNGGSVMAYASRAAAEPAYQLYGMTLDGQHYFQLTEDANKVKREPVWNSDGNHVAYSVQSLSATTSASLLLPNNWLVYVTDLDKNAALAGVGADPFFSPDGKTLFALQNDGLHGVSVASVYAPVAVPAATSTKTKTTVKFVTFGPLLAASPLARTVSTSSPQATALKSMKISVSPDGKTLAWSVPTAGYVRIYSIQSWSPLTLVKEKDLPLTALYSVFSPDSQYLALEQVALDPVAKRFIDPSIVIYRLSDGASTTALDLSAYSTSFSGLSGWR